LVYKNLHIGITRNIETMSVVKVIDVKSDTIDTVGSSLVIALNVVLLDRAASHTFIVALNICTNVDFSFVLGEQHLTNVVAEPLCRAKLVSAGMAEELFDGVSVASLMQP
jgi:hypothetical protein